MSSFSMTFLHPYFSDQGPSSSLKFFCQAFGVSLGMFSGFRVPKNSPLLIKNNSSLSTSLIPTWSERNYSDPCDSSSKHCLSAPCLPSLSLGLIVDLMGMVSPQIIWLCVVDHLAHLSSQLISLSAIRCQ